MWMEGRVHKEFKAIETPIGYIPKHEFDKGGYVGISKGIKKPESLRKKLSKARKGKVRCRRISDGEVVFITREEFHKNKHLYKGLTAGIKWSKESPLKGRTKETDESIAKMAETLRGRKCPEHSARMYEIMKDENLRKRISEKLTGRNKKENRSNFNQSVKLSKGLYITPRGVFYSSNDAARALNASPTAIIKFCKNHHRKISRSTAMQTTCTSITLADVGKTFLEVGFYYVKFPANFDKHSVIGELYNG